MAIHETELYLHAGLALARAQLLERVIVNALVAIEIIPEQRENPISFEEWEKKYDEYIGEKYGLSLGRLIKALKSVASVPPDLERVLEEALKVRNTLIHRFFRTHHDSVLNPSLSGGAIQELVEAQKLFQVAEQNLVSFMRPIYERYAVTPALRQYLEQGRI